MGKLMALPNINFSGKYYIGSHSCGADCRYYSLSDLSDGSDSNALDTFSDDGGNTSENRRRRIYVTTLVSRPNGRMLIVQYHITQSDPSKEKCRERFFSLSDDERKVLPMKKPLNLAKDLAEATRMDRVEGR